MRTRPRRMVIAFVITAVLSSSAPVFAHVTSGPPSDVCEVVVRLENGAGPAVRAALARRRLNVKKETYKGRGLLVRVPPGRSAEEVAAELSSVDGVSIATPNGRVRALWTPSDSLHPQQWGMGAIQMPAAWDIERGDSAVTVAVIDTGAQLDHPDLAGNLDIASDYDFADDDDTADDTNGHGTHVCGIIAAVTDNATGVAGVAPGVRVLPLKIIDESGYGSISDLADAIIYATDHGADVVNMSLGEALDLTRPSDAAQAQYMQEAIDYAFTRDVVLIAAAGNASEGATSVFYPAACDGVIAVAATARSGEVASYSCYGPEVDIAAPGGDGTIRQNLIISTFLGSAYQYMQGTSMASPHVAGAAALLRSHVATASASRVANALVYSAADISPEGWDEHSGHGLLQVASALEDLHIPSPSVERLAGNDRYQTALAVSRSTLASGTSTVTVVASGQTFPDALSASALAGAYKGALLLTQAASLPEGLIAELERLGTSQVVLVGGTAAISSTVEAQLTQESLAVTRVSGSDRYATAAAVAEKVRSVLGTGTPSEVFLVRGDDFADAVAVAPLAYALGTPVLLTTPQQLDTHTRSAFASLGTEHVIIAGGATAVSTDVADSVDALPGVTTVERWAGADRYETAAFVASRALERGRASGGTFGLATGSGFADALAGSVSVGSRGGTLLLAKTRELPSAAHGVIASYGSAATTVWVYGGVSVVSNDVLLDISSIRY